VRGARPARMIGMTAASGLVFEVQLDVRQSDVSVGLPPGFICRA
jgi:hypothetical protein